MLPDQPTESVIAVLGLAEIFREAASRFVAPATVLIDNRITVAHKVLRDLGACPGPRDRSRALGPARCGFVVGRTLQQHWKRTLPGRAIDIGRQSDAVPCQDDDVAFDDHLDRFGYSHVLPRRLPAARVFATPSVPTPIWSWARSSAGEHYVDIVGVTGSIPVAPTMLFKHLGH